MGPPAAPVAIPAPPKPASCSAVEDVVVDVEEDVAAVVGVEADDEAGTEDDDEVEVGGATAEDEEAGGDDTTSEAEGLPREAWKEGKYI